MNKVILVGRLVRDPEYSATENWTPVCTFTLAVNREYKGEDGRKVADFFRVVAWNDLADLVRKYCKKGDRVGVTGSAQIYTREDDEGATIMQLNIVAKKVEFMGKAEDAPAQLQRIDKKVKLEHTGGPDPFEEG